jgi:periplasmic divalent cation tolerance protein
MTSAKSFVVVLVTAPNIKVARHLASGALREKLVACANLLPKVESHYRWKGKVESSTEVMAIFKTTVRKLPALETFVLANHPYDTPEFLVLSPSAGAERYLRWISESVK